MAVAVAVAVAVPRSSHAQQAPPAAERVHVYSEYERETIDATLASLHAHVDPAPEGKLIERVEIVPLDVVEPRDPLPLFLNWFHATSRPFTIRREMVLHEGDRFQQVLVDESIRDLRRLLQLSLVLVVATEGSAPDRVGVVVITKDVWSLRMNWNGVITPGGVEFLHAQPSETNLLGTHQTLHADIALDPKAYALGFGYVVPRIGYSRVALVGNVDLILNRDSGAAEGSLGQFIAGEPFYSALDEWAWDTRVQWLDDIERAFSNAALQTRRDPRTGYRVPFQYRARTYLLRPEVTRSFGWDVKNDVTFGFGLDHRAYRTDFSDAWLPGSSAFPLPAQAVDYFRTTYMPVSDTRVGPSVQWHSYTKRYVRVIDFDTLALQEDYRLGHDVVVRVWPSARAIGSTRDVLGLYGAAQYTVALRDGVFRAAVASTLDSEPDRISDAAFEPMAHLATPTIAGLGRVVVDGSLLWRLRNYLNQTTFLGGDDRLRGYPTNFLVGKDVVAYNVELRSRPVQIFTMQVAGVAFFDAGDAFNGFDRLQPLQSVGLGVRSLFPQLDRTVFRFDFGVPLQHPIDPNTLAPIPAYGFLATFGQAFLTPTVSPPPVLPTGQ